MDAEANEQWRDYMKQYDLERTNVAWTKAEPPPRKTHKDVWKLETQYNPILQSYTDPTVEANVRQLEHDRLIDTLAKNKDRALRYEQTFNVVNLENKLKGLEGLPGYPQEQSQLKKKFLAESKAPYNIISNLDLADHHYLPPEERPAKPAEAPRTYKINAVEYRDFDIISNKYLQSHEDKQRDDIQRFKQEAAEKYWRTHDYDPVNVCYFDPDKEEEFRATQVERAKVHGHDVIEKLPNGVKYSEGALYQPINMRVVDANRLHEIDLKHKLAKQRYEARYDIEEEYRERDIMEQERDKLRTLNRLDYQRHVEGRERGYNIVNNVPFYGRVSEAKYPPMTQPKPNLWERTMSQALPSRPITQALQSKTPGSRISTPASRSIRSSGFRIAS